mmetsp:Transcript_73531/g.153428  ORF Transcript_73531/g.153428 Transcript_73531/m.153428 type:complete len:211 (-) Transcript_73531:1656-2288(-)
MQADCRQGWLFRDHPQNCTSDGYPESQIGLPADESNLLLPPPPPPPPPRHPLQGGAVPFPLSVIFSFIHSLFIRSFVRSSVHCRLWRYWTTASCCRISSCCFFASSLMASNPWEAKANASAFDCGASSWGIGDAGRPGFFEGSCSFVPPLTSITSTNLGHFRKNTRGSVSLAWPRSKATPHWALKASSNCSSGRGPFPSFCLVWRTLATP